MVQWFKGLFTALFMLLRHKSITDRHLSYNLKDLKKKIWDTADILYALKGSDAIWQLSSVIEMSRNVHLLELAKVDTSKVENLSYHRGRIEALNDLLGFIQEATDTDSYKKRTKATPEASKTDAKVMMNRRTGTVAGPAI